MATKATKLSDDELKAVLRAVPQRIIGQMCGGRQTVHLQRVANRWGFPIDGKTVDLFAVMTRLWSFLTQYGPMLSALMEDAGKDDADEDALGVRYLRAKTKKTEAEAAMVQLRFEEKNGTLCPRGVIHEFLLRLANRIRTAGEQAQRTWGEDGFEMFHQLELAAKDIAAKVIEQARTASEANSTNEKQPRRSVRSAPKAKRPGRSRRTTTKGA